MEPDQAEDLEGEEEAERASGTAGRKATGGKPGDDDCCSCGGSSLETSLSGKTRCDRERCPNGLEPHYVRYCSANKCTEFACGKYIRKNKRSRGGQQQQWQQQERQQQQQEQQQPSHGAQQQLQLFNLLTSGIDTLAQECEVRAEAAGTTNCFEFVIAATEIAKQRAIALPASA